MVVKHGIDTPAASPTASAAVTPGSRPDYPHEAINNQMLMTAIDNARLELHKELGGELRGEIKGVETKLSGEITELRGEIKGVETKLSGEITELRGEIKGVETKLSGEITELRGEIKGVETKLGGRIDRVETKLSGEIKELGGELRGEMTKLSDELKKNVDKAIFYAMTISLGIVGIVASAFAIMNL